MKILQITYESMGNPFGLGGAGFRAYEIYKRLRQRHDITLLCMKYTNAADRDIEGLRHVFVGTESKSLVKSVFAFTIKAAGYIRKHGNDYDIIVENFLPATPFFSKYLTRTPSILQIQGVWKLHLMRKFNPFYGFLLYIMENVYLAMHSRFLFVTRVNMDRLIKKSKDYSVVPNGIDEEYLRYDNKEDDYILFFSRIDTYQKGLDILMDAFTLTAEKVKGIKLVLAGYEFNSTAELFRRLPEHLRKRVRYAGFVTGVEKRRLLSGARLLVLPSRHEAHPVSILEALACEKAVVVSNLPELRYIEENGLGLTFQSGSPRDLSKKLITLLEDRALRKDLGIRGRRFASRFLWDDIALKFERFLMSVARKNG